MVKLYYSLYKERRFDKLGYTARALFDCIAQFQRSLEKTAKNNLLARACRLYLESDYVMAGLKTLSNFTYHVTVSLLNCVERVDQNVLCSIIPNLFQELQNDNLICDDLKPFHIKWTHVTMKKQEPKTAPDKYIFKLLCQSAASGIELHCTWKYRSNWEGTVRATFLHELYPRQHSKLPTNNLCAKWYFAKFGSLTSESAHHSNNVSKGKRIRDDLMFNKSKKSAEKLSSKFIENYI